MICFPAQRPTELEDIYRFDFAVDYIGQSRGRVHLTEEQINTIHHMLKLKIAQFCNRHEMGLLEP